MWRNFCTAVAYCCLDVPAWSVCFAGGTVHMRMHSTDCHIKKISGCSDFGPPVNGWMTDRDAGIIQKAKGVGTKFACNSLSAACGCALSRRNRDAEGMDGLWRYTKGF